MNSRENIFNTLSRSYGREPAGISHYRDMMGGQVRIIFHLRRRMIQRVAQEWLAEGARTQRKFATKHEDAKKLHY